MASYKVPQDVEADDKLIGPFTFRQFIYLMIVAGGIGLAWALGRLFLPLAAIPLPIIILFAALALPLRKDQPMETYLAAILSYYLKPRVRVWDPDGIATPIEITAPKESDDQVQLKNLSQSEAEKRLGYLADLADTHGWAIRGQGVQPPSTTLNSDIYFEAQQAPDVLDENNSTSQIIDQKLSKSSADRRQAAIKKLTNPEPTPAPVPPKSVVPQIPVIPKQQNENEKVTFNPYPSDMKQTIVQPLETTYQATAKVAPKTTSNNTVSADIINLASNNDLTIETIAREANRLNKKSISKDEVIISLH